MTKVPKDGKASKRLFQWVISPHTIRNEKFRISILIGVILLLTSCQSFTDARKYHNAAMGFTHQDTTIVEIEKGGCKQ